MKFVRIFASSLVLFSPALRAQWIAGFYGAQNGVLPVSAIPWSKYTHVIHFAAAPNADGTVDLHYLIQAEINQIVAARPAGKKVIVCIKDNDSDLNAFPSATSSGTISTFVNNVVNFVNSNGYDGVDLDWEANTNVSQFQDLINRLKAAMPGKVVAMDGGNWGGLESVAGGAAGSLDQVNIMCYDMDSPGNGYSWFNDALLQAGNSSLATCDWRVSSFINAGVPASKIGIGIPFYGRRWSGTTQPMTTGSFNPSTFLFRDLATDTSRWQSQYQTYDSTHKSNYLSIPSMNEFDSYNGPQFMTDVVAWQKSRGFGGFMTFTMDYEYIAGQSGDSAYPLSTALASAVFGGSTPSASGGSAGPIVSGGSPTGALSAGTATATLSANTNVNATCRYATSAGVSYSSMPYGFSVNGGTAHSSSLAGLQNGTSYSYYVRCQDSSGNVDTSDYAISFSVASSVVASGPMSVTAAPNSGSGSSQAFMFQVYDPNGAAALSQLDIILDTAVGQPNSCWVEYAPATGTLYMKSDDNTAWGSTALAGGGILQNSQCSVNPAASSASISGNLLTLNLGISFSSAYAGSKTMFGFAADSASSTGWLTIGNWNVTVPVVVTPSGPTVQLTPSSGSGGSATFSMRIADTLGAASVVQGALVIGNAVGGTNSCYIDYDPSTRTISLMSSNNAAWYSAAIGSSTVLRNGQCAVNAHSATVSSSGNTLTVNIPVNFNKNYTGPRALYTFGADAAGASTGWQQAGTWTVR